MDKLPTVFYAYILRCADDSLYTGWTNDLPKRVETHNSGKGARYTRVRLPVQLVASWEFSSKREAMQKEYQLKLLRREEKLKLIASHGISAATSA